jgi:hypothetical protein
MLTNEFLQLLSKAPPSCRTRSRARLISCLTAGPKPVGSILQGPARAPRQQTFRPILPLGKTMRVSDAGSLKRLTSDESVSAPKRARPSPAPTPLSQPSQGVFATQRGAGPEVVIRPCIDPMETIKGTDFHFNEEHCVLVCQWCRTCLSPAGVLRWKDHLYREPHRLTGVRLSETIDLLSPYESRMRSLQELRQHRPSRRSPCPRIAGLDASPGYLCVVEQGGCDFATTRLAKMHDHMLPAHNTRAAEHDRQTRPLWTECMLQTYFTVKEFHN